MKNEIAELGVECSCCHKKRGKYAQPWRRCVNCGVILCLNCSHSHLEPKCHKCWRKEWDAAYARKKKTPVECSVCHKEKLYSKFQFGTDVLPKDIEGYQMAEFMYVDGVKLHLRTCKACAKKILSDAANKRKALAVPGLVEVQYGELPCPEHDGGRGYAYYFDEPLELGDIVETPPSYLAKYREESNVATVVSTYSDYHGEVSCIVRVVRKCQQKETPHEHCS